MAIPGTKTPGIADPRNSQQCLENLKEITELRNGVIGPIGVNGQRLDRFITYRELESLILNNAAIATAIAEAVSTVLELQDPVDTSIVSGVITLAGSGMVTVSAESGVEDQLDKIEGLSKGNTVYLLAASGHTITIAAGTYLKVPYPTSWTLTGYRVAAFDCIGGDVCVMRSHEANRT